MGTEREREHEQPAEPGHPPQRTEEKMRGQWESEGGALVEGPHTEERIDDDEARDPG